VCECGYNWATAAAATLWHSQSPTGAGMTSLNRSYRYLPAEGPGRIFPMVRHISHSFGVNIRKIKCEHIDIFHYIFAAVDL